MEENKRILAWEAIIGIASIPITIAIEKMFANTKTAFLFVMVIGILLLMVLLFLRWFCDSNMSPKVKKALNYSLVFILGVVITMFATGIISSEKKNENSEKDMYYEFTPTPSVLPTVINTPMPTDVMEPTVTDTPIPTDTPMPIATSTPLPTETSMLAKMPTISPTKTTVPESKEESSSGGKVTPFFTSDPKVDTMTRVSLVSWEENDRDIFGMTYPLAYKLSVYNLLDAMAGGSSDIMVEVHIPLGGRGGGIWAVCFVVAEEMVGNESSASVTILSGDEVLFPAFQIDSTTTEELLYEIDVTDMKDLVFRFECNSVNKGFVVGIVFK